jgi:hypothetical protein
MMHFQTPSRSLALVIPAMAYLFGLAAPAYSVEAQHGSRDITCMNTSSGTKWQIKVDYDQKTVDANQASIGDTQISWRDAKDGWRYSLDQKTGDLRAVVPSATGGSIYFYRCMLDH